MEVTEGVAAVSREEEGKDVPVFNADGTPAIGPDGKPTVVGVIGSYSPKYRKAFNAALREEPSENDAGIDPRDINVLVACTTGWSGFTKNGQPFPFTPDNARWLYTSLPWVRNQVDRAVGDHARFFANGSAS